VDGRQYFTQETIGEFTDRAKRGDFAQAPVVPKRNETISGSCVRVGESKQKIKKRKIK
jgi:hypothetical protein